MYAAYVVIEIFFYKVLDHILVAIPGSSMTKSHCCNIPNHLDVTLYAQKVMNYFTKPLVQGKAGLHLSSFNAFKSAPHILRQFPLPIVPPETFLLTKMHVV